MRIDVLTIFPELFERFLDTGVLGRGLAKGLLEIEVHDLRDYTDDPHRSVDDATRIRFGRHQIVSHGISRIGLRSGRPVRPAALIGRTRLPLR